MVARQFVAWDSYKARPSRRDGLRSFIQFVSRPTRRLNIDSTSPYRSLRDDSPFDAIPGNKLPGYDHLVPTGQIRSY